MAVAVENKKTKQLHYTMVLETLLSPVLETPHHKVLSEKYRIQGDILSGIRNKLGSIDMQTLARKWSDNVCYVPSPFVYLSGCGGTSFFSEKGINQHRL